MSRKPLIVACIPAFNEERTIAKVVIRTRMYVDKVLICDDGSTDMTGEIAERLGAVVIRNSHGGKGSALKTALGYAKQFNPTVILTLDADGQHDPDEIPKLLQPVLKGEADIVNGSRFLGKTDMPVYRRIGNKVLNLLTNMNIGQKLTDTQSGFRAYSSKALEVMEITDEGMGVDSRILMDLSKMGLRIVEVPVEVSYRDVRSTYNPVRHLLMVVDSIVGRVVGDNPILYLGVPGFILVAAGLLAGMRVIEIFLSNRAIATGTAMISITLVIVGFLLIVAAIIVKTVNTVTEKMKRHLEA